MNAGDNYNNRPKVNSLSLVRCKPSSNSIAMNGDVEKNWLYRVVNILVDDTEATSRKRRESPY